MLCTISFICNNNGCRDGSGRDVRNGGSSGSGLFSVFSVLKIISVVTRKQIVILMVAVKVLLEVMDVVVEAVTCNLMYQSISSAA